MSDKLKRSVQWSLYIFILIVISITMICLVISILSPTFFPEKDISGFKDYIDTLCVILSFLSVGLSVYSIIQAISSGKQANEMIKSIQELKAQQKILCVTLKSINACNVVSHTDAHNDDWKPDNVNT